MRTLLYPRSHAAYGQDFLATALSCRCNLTMLEAGKSGYALPPVNLALLVSMNLDTKVDSNYVCSLPQHIPVVGHVHCQPSYYSSAQTANLVSAVKRVRIGIVPARFHQSELQKLFPAVKWKVVYNGIDRNRFQVANHKERRAFRKKMGIAQGLTLAIFIGRLENAKGLQILEEFCAQIGKTRLGLVVQFLSNSSKATQAYPEIAARLKAICPHRIFLFPDKDLMADRPVRHADVLLTPSLSEVCPLVVLEAFNAGVPVIGTFATPFYSELDQFNLPAGSYKFIPLPTDHNFRVERKDLSVSELEAQELAAELISLAVSKSPPTDIQRVALSDATLAAGFDQESMLAAFAKIYDTASI